MAQAQAGQVGLARLRRLHHVSASVLQRVRALCDAPELSRLTCDVHPQAANLATLEAALDAILSGTSLPDSRRELARATVLLWHDHWDPAHLLPQRFENADGSFVHAIIHRREPDYWNSKYWFRRAAGHPCLTEIATRARQLPAQADDPGLLTRLLSRGAWDALGFVDECQRCAGLPADDPAHLLARRLQRLEFEVLLAHLCP